MRGLILLLIALAACGRREVKPVPFADSDAFRGIAARALGFLEHDFSADGVGDVVVVQRVGPGVATSVYVQRATERGAVYELMCTGPVLEGEELDTLRWVQLGDRELLLLVAGSENPDVVEQAVALFPASDPCAPVFTDRVAAEKPSAELVAPAGLRGGVIVDERGDVFFVDRPKTVPLQGGGEPVEVLTGVRLRRLRASGGELSLEARDVSLLNPLPAEARWLRDGKPEDEAMELGELGDSDTGTQLYLYAGETGTLSIAAERPVRVVELTVGCEDGHASLDVAQHRVDGGAWEPLAGVARRPQAGKTFRSHVILLAKAGTYADLRLEARDEPQCLREVVTYEHAAR